MSEPAPVTRIRRKSLPVAPPALQRKVERSARVIEKHGKVLGPIGIAALQTATLQVVAQQLADIQALLQANGLASPTGRPVVQSPPVPAGPSCALCGRQGVYHAKYARVASGKKAPWYCEAHAGMGVQSDIDAKSTAQTMPVATGTTQPQPENVPNLAAAMAHLTGDA